MGSISASGTGSATPTGASAHSATRKALPRLTLAAAVLALLGTSPAPQLEVDIERLRSYDGLLHVCVTRDAAHFPDCHDDPDAVRRSFRTADTQSVQFRGLPSGNYAIAILHDENGNDRLDRFAGIPREGIGFSRNPRFSFGPPSFEAARFALGTGETEQRIRMRYFL